MRKRQPQIRSKLLLGLIMGLILAGFPFVEPAWAAIGAQQEQTTDYTIAFASLAPWDLDVFLANADGSDPKPLVSHTDFDYDATFSPEGGGLPLLHATSLRIKPPPGLLYWAYL